jgi:hypothetical protein
MGDISKEVANTLYPAQKYIKKHYLVDHKTSELRPLTCLVRTYRNHTKLKIVMSTTCF